MHITAIIPFRYGNDTLPKTLAALARIQRSAGMQLDVVISTDGHDQEPDISAGKQLPIMVIQDEQRGQSATTNRAARYARGEYLWLLAQDVIPNPDAHSQLINRLEQFNHPLVQGYIEQDSSHLGDPFVQHVLESGLQFTYGNVNDPNQLDPGLHYAPHALVSRDLFLTLGGYDEQLPYGMQDTDFGLRWRLSGHPIVLAKKSVVVHNHHYRFSAYRKREESVGHALVDMFIKWRKEAYLNRYLMTHRVFTQQLGPDIQIAQQLGDKWEATGAVPSGNGGFTGPLAVPDDALKSAFLIALSWARVEGVRARLDELGLLNHLPPLPSGFDPQRDNPTQWIREMAEAGLPS
jgi:GT2 family glycosyltransferase